MRDLSGAQSRQLIDCEQLFSAWREVSRTLRQRYSGSMSWKQVREHRYLYRKRDGDWFSLGPDSEETRRTYDAFHEGRATARQRKAALDDEIKAIAPINRAMRLGRVPRTSARILRRLDLLGVLGHGLKVAGTHALYAYESLGGVHFESDIVATLDIDLLYDARGGLDLLGSNLADTGLLGELRRLDSTFDPIGEGSYRAVNSSGFMVDLITPAQKAIMPAGFRPRIGASPDDLTAAEIDGLAWLESTPAVSSVAIDEHGFPLMIVAADPRAFMCHKLWVSERDDRNPMKRRRDRAQAEAVACLLTNYLPALGLDDPALNALPLEVRNKTKGIMATAVAAARSGGDWS